MTIWTKLLYKTLQLHKYDWPKEEVPERLEALDSKIWAKIHNDITLSYIKLLRSKGVYVPLLNPGFEYKTCSNSSLSIWSKSGWIFLYENYDDALANFVHQHPKTYEKHLQEKHDFNAIPKDFNFSFIPV